MYEEKDLNIVAQTVPVLQRVKQQEDIVIPSGHFDCECDGQQPMGVGRRYVTAVVYDWEHEQRPILSFVFAPGDKFYREKRRVNETYGWMCAADDRTVTSLYVDRQRFLDMEIYPRIVNVTLEDREVHKNGIVRIRDLIDIEPAINEDGDAYNQEISITMYNPLRNGTYYKWEPLSRFNAMSAADRRAALYVHPHLHEKIRAKMSTSWQVYDPKPPKKRKSSMKPHAKRQFERQGLHQEYTLTDNVRTTVMPDRARVQENAITFEEAQNRVTRAIREAELTIQEEREIRAREQRVQRILRDLERGRGN